MANVRVRVSVSKTPQFTYVKIFPHGELDLDVCIVELQVGDTSIYLSFDYPEDMIAFCDKHNIPYEDLRTRVDKYRSGRRRQRELADLHADGAPDGGTMGIAL